MRWIGAAAFQRGGFHLLTVRFPDGRVHVMQTYALIVDPNLAEAQLSTRGCRLELPEGSQYRVRKLDSDLGHRLCIAG